MDIEMEQALADAAFGVFFEDQDGNVDALWGSADEAQSKKDFASFIQLVSGRGYDSFARLLRSKRIEVGEARGWEVVEDWVRPSDEDVILDDIAEYRSLGGR